MKKIFKVISILLILIVFINSRMMLVNANDGLYVWTKSSILMETETGKVLAENNSDKAMSPASLSKIMTFLLSLEAIEDGYISLDDRITISKKASNTGSSSYRLRKGDVVDLRELIESMMIVSSNCSSVAIAEHISGNIEEFIVLMNKRARELGMENTRFINPHGLPIYKSSTRSISNKSTARDLAVLCRYLLTNYKDETLRVTNKMKFKSRFNGYSGTNTNPLLNHIKGIDGIKTGYTGKAGYCLAFTKKLRADSDNTENMRVIGIVLGAGNNRDREKGSKALLEYGKENFFKKTIIKKGDYVGEEYLYEEEDFPIRFISDNSLILVRKGETPQRFIKDKEIILNNLRYPIKKGEKVGNIRYTLYDDRIVNIGLVSDTEINDLPILLMIKLWWKKLIFNNNSNSINKK